MSAKPNLTKAMQSALDVLTKDGQLFPYNDHSLSTLEALERRGLARIEHHPPSHSYGSLGTRGGTARGRWTREWIAYPTEGTAS